MRNCSVFAFIMEIYMKTGKNKLLIFELKLNFSQLIKTTRVVEGGVAVQWVMAWRHGWPRDNSVSFGN